MMGTVFQSSDFDGKPVDLGVLITDCLIGGDSCEVDGVVFLFLSREYVPEK